MATSLSACSTPDARITATSYYFRPDSAISIADGQVLTDGSTDYSGTLTEEQIAAIAGKTIMAKTYTITYDLEGGTLATENTDIYIAGVGATTLNNPTKAGYKFTGWTGTDLTEPTRTVTIAKGASGNRSYTATWGDYTNKYYVRTPDDLNITSMGWNFPAGVITASADKDDFDPDKKIVVTAKSANGWALKDTVFWHFNSDTVPYILKNASTDTTSTTAWEISYADLVKDGGTTITFGAQVSDFTGKRPGAYNDKVSFSIEVQ